VTSRRRRSPLSVSARVFTATLGFGLALGPAAAGPARAEAIRCTFTEPSLTTLYDPGRRLLAVHDPVTDYPRVARTFYRHVVRVRTGPRRFELRVRGVLLARLVRDGRGSDGMSEHRYAYTVEGPPGRPSGQGYDGGCDPMRPGRRS
jgi:hypothetical protein